MAAFDGENSDEEWKIERLFQPVVIFNELQVLVDAMSYLKERGYIVHEIDCRALQTPDAICNEVLQKLGNLPVDFSISYSSGMEFWSLVAPDVPPESGMALAFKHFDDFHSASPGWAQTVASILARHHFALMRRGLRFMMAAHCEHEIELEPLMTVSRRQNTQKWDAASVEKFERRLANRRAMQAAHEEIARRFPGLKRQTFDAALRDLTGDSSTAPGMMDLSADDITRLLQGYDFDSAMRREREIERNRQALDAAYRILAERHPILPAPTFVAPFHRLYWPLREVTGVSSYAEVEELDLSTQEIVRLLQDYDFSG